MIKLLEEKNCQACGKTIRGRSDKKFCDDYCRNSFNNLLRSDVNNYMRSINTTLRKNRRVLKELLTDEEKMKKVSKETLYSKGFQFKYHTHSLIDKDGKTYYFCYEFGYLPLENDFYLVLTKN